MSAKTDEAKPLDLYFDTRLQGRFISEGKISQEDVVNRTLAGPDAAGNSVRSGAVDQTPAPPRSGARPSRVKAAPRD